MLNIKQLLCGIKLLVSHLYLTFVMQVTPKTLADVKGGTLISYEGRVQACICHWLHFFII